jgi:anti-sigma B factor antagonist
MRLTLQSQLMNDVVVIRCQGRITLGVEVDALEAEVQKQTRIPGTDFFVVKKVVLQLAGTDYIDSSGLGALVRMFGVLRAAGGGLKLCELSASVLRVFEVTNLESLIPTYSSESEAINAFGSAPRAPGEQSGAAKLRIVCVDASSNLLAGLSALLTSSGYEVLVTRHVGEAATLVKATKPQLVIYGPGILTLATGPAAIEKLRQSGRDVQILHLPSDFSTAEAGQAGVDLVNQVRELLAS